MFHPQHLSLRVRIVSDVHEFADIWWIDFFEFAVRKITECELETSKIFRIRRF